MKTKNIARFFLHFVCDIHFSLTYGNALADKNIDCHAFKSPFFLRSLNRLLSCAQVSRINALVSDGVFLASRTEFPGTFHRAQLVPCSTVPIYDSARSDDAASTFVIPLKKSETCYVSAET